jgi:hypothetical protein
VDFESLNCPWERAEAYKPEIYKSSLLAKNAEQVTEHRVH